MWPMLPEYCGRPQPSSRRLAGRPCSSSRRLSAAFISGGKDPLHHVARAWMLAPPPAAGPPHSDHRSRLPPAQDREHQFAWYLRLAPAWVRRASPSSTSDLSPLRVAATTPRLPSRSASASPFRSQGEISPGRTPPSPRDPPDLTPPRLGASALCVVARSPRSAAPSIRFLWRQPAVSIPASSPRRSPFRVRFTSLAMAFLRETSTSNAAPMRAHKLRKPRFRPGLSMAGHGSRARPDRSANERRSG